MRLWLASPVASDIPDESFNPQTWEKLATQQIRDFQQSSIYGPVYNRISPPKNMILFIGDGMSSSTITAARYLKAANMKKPAGEVVLDWELWPTVSLVHTFSANRMTTDSAAAATAIVCGSKVAQFVVGLAGVKECCMCESFDPAQKLQSTLIQAQKKGLSVGIVTTTRITHATPAATYAHSTDRNQENQPYALTETLVLERAVNSTIELVDTNQTLVLVTADHSHGYGVIGYANRRTHILGLDDSQLPRVTSFRLMMDIRISSQITLVVQELPLVNRVRILQPGEIFGNAYRQQALIPLRRGVHAADDVPLYATGPFNQLFHRPVDNTFVAYATMFSLCLGPYENEPHCSQQNATSSTDLPAV
ncbi:hypothetical protein AHF37_10829 [Paragonimus kellicotti]|nr:hypothetical protein AHF37_10829 [Paragonimus kellicotti]